MAMSRTNTLSKWFNFYLISHSKKTPNPSIFVSTESHQPAVYKIYIDTSIQVLVFAEGRPRPKIAFSLSYISDIQRMFPAGQD